MFQLYEQGSYLQPKGAFTDIALKLSSNEISYKTPIYETNKSGYTV